TAIPRPVSNSGTRVVTSRAHLLPPSANAASCSGVHTSSRTSSLGGPESSTKHRRRLASCGSVNVASSSATSLITSLTLLSTAAAPLTSRPTVTRYMRPLNRCCTHLSAHTILAKVVLPDPPAPYSP